ncbi:MAG: Phosphoserine phosphatase RsbU [Candidatus Anoxychlamydiales bacterium]|nr:Phosphoserine phosphatase RsbU [Candidatus Anoxychlamydiales bacterium]
MNLAQSKTKNIKSFLATRVFFIILILVILPLIIYLAILYRAEYKEQKQDLLISMNILKDQISKNIEDNLKFKNEILDFAINEINRNGQNVNKCFSKITTEFNLQDLYYLDFSQNYLFLMNSTKQNLIGKNLNSLKNILNQKNFLFSTELLSCKDCIYFSKTFYKNNYPKGAFVLSFFKSELLSDLPKDKFFKNIDLKILDSNKNIVLSNEIFQSNGSTNAQNQKVKMDQLQVQKDLKNLNLKLILSLDQKYLKIFHQQNFVFKHTFILSIVFVILLILTWIVISFISKPVKTLLLTMKEIKEGNVNKRYKKQKLGFEINYIGSFFNNTMDSLIAKQKEIEREKIEKQRYIQELEIAEDIQISLLPQKPLDIKDVDISFGNLFAKEVGGDFYDFFLKDGKIFFVIADIATKGILACLYALNLRSTIRSYASTFDNLDEIILKTNNLFFKDAKEKSMFATAFFGIYDIKSKNLKYSNQGHMSAILRKEDSTITELTTKGIALGVEEMEKVYINEITLQKNDLLFLYTDGITEAIDKNNKFFGKENLVNLIKDTKDLNASEIIERLFKKLEDYSRDAEQFDDMTALLFKII